MQIGQGFLLLDKQFQRRYGEGIFYIKDFKPCDGGCPRCTDPQLVLLDYTLNSTPKTGRTCIQDIALLNIYREADTPVVSCLPEELCRPMKVK